MAQGSTLFLMSEVPHANFVNPAVQSPWQWIVGIPALASLQANYTNTAFSINEAIKANSSSYNFDNIIEGLNGVEFFQSDAQYTPIFVGFRRHGFYYNFSISERISTQSTIPDDVAKVIWQGNAYNTGRISLNRASSKEMQWREYSFGMSKDLSEKLTLGFHTKVLFGKGLFETSKIQGFMETDERNYNLTLDIDAEFRASLPIDVSYYDNGYISNIAFKESANVLAYELNRRNPGIAFDFGFSFDIDAYTTISGSILNLGFINWKSDISTLSINGSYTYSGFEASDGIYSNAIYNRMAEEFDSERGSSPFTSSLTPELYLGIKRKYSNHWQGGVTVYNRLMLNKLYPSLTVSATTYGYERMTAAISYTVIENDYFNVGAGIGLRIGHVHFHAAADNLLGFLAIADQNNLNYRFGISIVPSELRTIIPKSCNCFDRWEGRKNTLF